MNSVDTHTTVLIAILHRAGFTPSGAPVQKNMWRPIVYEYPVTPSPRLPSPDTIGADTHSSHHRHFVEDRAALHTTIAAAADWQFEASLSKANCKRVREL